MAAIMPGKADVRLLCTDSASACAALLASLLTFHLSIPNRPIRVLACEATTCSLSRSGAMGLADGLEVGAGPAPPGSGLGAGVCDHINTGANKRSSIANRIFIFHPANESQTRVADEAGQVRRNGCRELDAAQKSKFRRARDRVRHFYRCWILYSPSTSSSLVSAKVALRSQTQMTLPARHTTQP